MAKKLLRKSDVRNLPLNLPSGSVRPEGAAQALAAAANALLALASAFGANARAPSSDTHSLTPPPAGPSLIEVINELLRAKARANRTLGYLKILRIQLRRFAHGHPGRPIADITPAEVEHWIFGLSCSERHRRGHFESVRTLFFFALKRGYIRSNPAAAVELPDDDARMRPPEIHTPEQVKTVLDTMRQHDLNVCRFLAIRYFAGLRGSEVQRLRPEYFKKEDGLIEVPAAIAKSRRRRLVTIEPALAAWLELGGELPVRDLNTRLARVGKLSGVPWSPGVTRHSFCSYHLAQFESAAKTALQAGHSEAMLFEHYRALVTRKAAAAFWAIRPE